MPAIPDSPPDQLPLIPVEAIEEDGQRTLFAAAPPAAAAGRRRSSGRDTPAVPGRRRQARERGERLNCQVPGSHDDPADSGQADRGDAGGLQGTAGPEDPLDNLRWTHHSQVNPLALAPVMRHYVELKRQHPGRLLLYRLGDFFECFFEDAITASRELELALTGKEAGRGIGRVPMAGIPHHAAERYCGLLVARGHGIALCDQLEASPSQQGGLIRREITRVITPGTVIEEAMLTARRNNWLAAVVGNDDARTPCWGLAIADISTGEFQATQLPDSAELQQELLRLGVAELVWAAGAEAGGGNEARRPGWCPAGIALTASGCTPFTAAAALARLLDRFQLASVDGLGLGSLPLALGACGGLLSYLDSTRPGTTVPLAMPTTYQRSQYLVLDHQTARNLELTQTQRDGLLQGSLLWAIDRTVTAMGGRSLRRWLQQPLLEREAIEQRQDSIAELLGNSELRLCLRRLLRPMGDLERLAGRAGAGTASARDLVALADGLERLPRLAGHLADSISPHLAALRCVEPDLLSLTRRLRETLTPTPPLSLSEGGLILDGVDETLDDLRDRIDGDEVWLRDLEQRERQATGISNLKLCLHRSFGYFLSVSKAKAGQVPDHYIRRQTLANEERFVTPELKEREGRILSLRRRTAQLEYELFCRLREEVGLAAEAIRRAAVRVARLDVLVGLAELAATQHYCRPTLLEGRAMEIVAGRHPVVEQTLVGGQFSANDLHLGEAGRPDLMVLTGPNASGKSCYLRQTGLLQLLSQIGSYVPAERAQLSLCDRIFTRVGAVDDLAAGQSTFMVEMTETANILHHASSNSLVLLDEIGRGTATFDGLSIAWAVAEDLAERIRARTVFATHYHELNELATQLSNVANFQVTVLEQEDRLVFMHRVRAGGADRSYGIEAARLAGLPSDVVLRARQVLGRIEANSRIAVDGEPEAVGPEAVGNPADPSPRSLRQRGKGKKAAKPTAADRVA